MKVLILSKNNPFQGVLADEFKMHEHAVTISAQRTKLSVQNFDVCVDISAEGIKDVKRVTETLKKTVSHYILLSTCQIYTAAAKLAPWDVDEIDFCDDTGFNTVDMKIRLCRAAERELKHLGSKVMPWTILRPSIVETKKNPEENNMWWFVSRILDGGPIVLPDDDDPLFRHVSDVDLAKAVRILAGRQEAYSQTIHVTSHALMSFESYARLIMNGINKRVSIVRVPGVRWKAAGLGLPMEKYLWRSFIDDSPLLDHLGWQPLDESRLIQEYASFLVENPLEKSKDRAVELALLETPAEHSVEFLQQGGSETWCLMARPGQPLSFQLGYKSKDDELPTPLFRTLRGAMGMAEERLLLEPLPDTRSRIIGHNVMLEFVGPEEGDLQPGSLYLPVAQMPCSDSLCSLCATPPLGLAGIADEGFGAEYVSVPQEYLVAVPSELSSIALLADPLACLLSVLPSLLAESDGPVWIFGQRVEAMLAILIIKETNRPFIHVGRTKLIQNDFTSDFKSMTLQNAEEKVHKKSLVQPTMVINLSGAADGENLLVRALSEGGFLVTPYAAVTQAHRRRFDVRLPLAAPSRLWLEKALYKLNSWSTLYNLDSFLQPIPLANFRELFIADQFCQSFFDVTRAGK